MQQALQIGELNAVAVIPRPLDDLEQNHPGLLNRRATQTLDTVKNQGKEEEAELLPLKIKRKGRGSRADNTARFNKVPSQIKTNDDFSYYL